MTNNSKRIRKTTALDALYAKKYMCIMRKGYKRFWEDISRAVRLCIMYRTHIRHAGCRYDRHRCCGGDAVSIRRVIRTLHTATDTADHILLHYYTHSHILRSL